MQQPTLVQRYRLQAPDIDELIPPVPQTLEETGIPYPLIQDLVLRRLFLTGLVSGLDLSHQLHLPYNGVVEVVLQNLIRDKLVDFTGGPGYGRPYFDYLLTDKGRDRARDAFERCGYVGPAPVPLPAYTSMVRKQMRDVARVGRSELGQAFHDMVMEHSFIERLGPAVNSVRSLFLYGAPGNGKTSIAERVATILKGEIFVPYALEVDGQIIQVFDPLVHRPIEPLAPIPEVSTGGELEDDDLSPPTQLHMQVEDLDLEGLEDVEEGRTVEVRAPRMRGTVRLDENTDGNATRVVELSPFDSRWVLSARPRIVVGGELTLENLDLTFNPGRYYEAPYQVKACCGMLLIDDFGRQKVHPTDLLNRWIVPLEKRVDFLTLRTGKKFEVPFDLLTIFSTNLDPSKLVDEAFLRRIRYKLEVPDPSEQVFRNIFRREADRQGVRFDKNVLDHMLQKYYRATGRPLRACHPRDILQLVQDQARFLRCDAVMTRKLVEQACDSYFVHMEGDKPAAPPQGGLTVESLLKL